MLVPIQSSILFTLVLFPCTCTDESSTDKPPTYPQMQQTTSLPTCHQQPSTYQALPSQMWQQSQMSQVQQPTGMYIQL